MPNAHTQKNETKKLMRINANIYDNITLYLSKKYQKQMIATSNRTNWFWTECKVYLAVLAKKDQNLC